MNINKAIRKQKKSFKRFWLSMSFIFLFLPITVVLTKRFSFFFIAYLLIIEFLIIITILTRTHKEILKFEYRNNMKIKNGLWRGKYTIICDKVMFVHTINQGKDMKIIMILKSRMRNDKIKVMDSKFLKKYTLAQGFNINFKVENLQKQYYYLIVNKGGYYKYELLDMIYRYCVKAHFTDDAIEKIKEYRN
ncbi:hypothetical protein [Clostridium ganghwense]|uniref:Transmembrane protein n=1 Tax=Clostridium ganghwense TaxID=312089 RepID=A0ABT4CLA4_9CLOT|nr:hypothetical protein [Clostridium ganghwense]MCY6369832.1 hypothetical protein [Clostridium ganghwense]